MPITQSFIECPFSGIGQRDPRAALFLLCAGAGTLLKTRGWRLHLAWRRPHSCVCDNRPQCWIPPLQAKARPWARRDERCWVLNLLFCVLCLCSGPRTHLSRGRCLCWRPVFPAVPASTASERSSAVCAPPACLPVSRLPEREPLTAYIPGRVQETSLALWCPGTDLSATSLGAGLGFLCAASFLPVAAPAGPGLTSEPHGLALTLGGVLGCSLRSYHHRF